MSKQAAENQDDLSDDEKAELEQQNQEQNQEDENLNDVEKAELARGWTTKDQWVADGHDEKDWRTAEHFKLVRDAHNLREDNKRYRNEIDGFDGRLKSVETLAQAGNEAQISDLQEKLEDAIADGQVDKSKAYQKDIDGLREKKTDAPAETGGFDEVITEWNKANPWIGNESPKSHYAGFLYQQGRKDGLSSQEIVDMVNREVEKEYPGTITGGETKTKVVNARRTEASTTESGKTKPGGKTSGLTMNDLTGDDKRVRENSVYLANLTDEKFLKLVAKTRAAEAADNE